MVHRKLVKQIFGRIFALALCAAVADLTTGCAGLTPAKPVSTAVTAADPAIPTPQELDPDDDPATLEVLPLATTRALLSATPANGETEVLEQETMPAADGESSAADDDVTIGESRQTANREDFAAWRQSAVGDNAVNGVHSGRVNGFDMIAGSALIEAEGNPPPSSQPADLWERIRSGFNLPPLDDSRVAYHERWFTKNPAYMRRKVARAQLYLYHIVEEVEKRGMPTEIALLPAIESAYHPHAYSRARALGLWQFIAPTARRYGIKMNWWYDGRRDVLASTQAALDYLDRLYSEFGDWHLALAAYNAGEGKIRYAIRYNQRRGRPATYPYLRLRAETRHYVPKLMAIANIVSDPDAYGITLASIPNEPYFTSVDVGSQIDLNVIARLADVPVGDLYDINPGFKRWATDPNGPHRVLVPIDKKDRLVDDLNQLPNGSRVKWRRHRVRRGDTLST
ncbi:MAG: transglycosylase SLT domain-containing protein, partial [Acidiferrobacterales bacterium]